MGRSRSGRVRVVVVVVLWREERVSLKRNCRAYMPSSVEAVDVATVQHVRKERSCEDVLACRVEPVAK